MTPESDPLFGHHLLLDRVLARLYSTQPVRLTLVGARLTGKSVFIHHLQRHLRNRYTGQEIGEILLVDCALLGKSEELWRCLQRETVHATPLPIEKSGELFSTWLEQFNAS